MLKCCRDAVDEYGVHNGHFKQKKKRFLPISRKPLVFECKNVLKTDINFGIPVDLSIIQLPRTSRSRDMIFYGRASLAISGPD